MFFDRLFSFDASRISTFDLELTLVGYVIVFAVLILLFLVFRFMPVILNVPNRIRAYRRTRRLNNGGAARAVPEEKAVLTGETNAAISAALFLYYNEMHDEEATILTIDKISRRYSPWSSKIYSVNNFRR